MRSFPAARQGRWLLQGCLWSCLLLPAGLLGQTPKPEPPVVFATLEHHTMNTNRPPAKHAVALLGDARLFPRLRDLLLNHINYNHACGYDFMVTLWNSETERESFEINIGCQEDLERSKPAMELLTPLFAKLWARPVLFQYTLTLPAELDPDWLMDRLWRLGYLPLSRDGDPRENLLPRLLAVDQVNVPREPKASLEEGHFERAERLASRRLQEMFDKLAAEGRLDPHARLDAKRVRYQVDKNTEWIDMEGTFLPRRAQDLPEVKRTLEAADLQVRPAKLPKTYTLEVLTPIAEPARFEARICSELPELTNVQWLSSRR